jgi:6,7-dimethyl-8-ribityllumazine synthase
MTTDLSLYDANQLPNADVLGRQRYAIIVADWNSEITFKLAQGAIDTFLKHGVKEENIEVCHVPGTVELTYAAAKIIKKQASPFAKQINAVIVIGCVIQGDTPHFDYVCQSVTQGVTILNAGVDAWTAAAFGNRAHVPVIFSVLTVLNQQQALDRCGGKLGNKGVEGAYTAMRMANL